MYLMRKFNGNTIHSKELGECMAFRIAKGEFVLFSKQNYDRMSELERKSRESKLDKKVRKLQRKLDKDISLKNKIKKELEWEEEQRKHELEYD